MNENTTKALVTLVFAGAAAYFRELLGPLIVLFLVMVIDYASGMMAACASKTLSSRVGIAGILKKIGYLFGVAVAIVADWVIQTAGAKAGIDLSGFYAFGLLVTVWLILNECISILENVSQLGVKLPEFLVTLVGKLKRTAEDKGSETVK